MKRNIMLEILVTVGIITTLTVTGLLLHQKYIPATRATRTFADIRNTVQALQMYYIYEDKWPVLEKGNTDLADVPGFNKYLTITPSDPFGTKAVPNLRYYSNGDPDTPATRWLLVSNGPDRTADVTDPTFEKADELVSGELGGRNGAIPKGKNKYYGYEKDAWSKATSTEDKGDIGRGGP